MTIYDSLKQTTRSLKNWSCRGRTDKVGYSVADSLLEIMQCNAKVNSPAQEAEFVVFT